MKKITFGFLAMSLACCSSCISSSSQVLSQEDIDAVTANPTGDAILDLGKTLKPLKNSAENQQMYWAGLRALTVLSGDGWEEARQALAYIHGRKLNQCVPVKAVKSIKEFQDRKEELEKENALIDESYSNKMSLLNERYSNNIKYIAKKAKWNVKFLQSDDGQNSFYISFKKGVPSSILERYGRGIPGKVTAGVPFREDMIGEYTVATRPWVESGDLRAQYGWKIHVSVWPSSAEKITSIVLNCMNDMENEGKEVCYKYPSTLPALRSLYFKTRYNKDLSQRGKAIAIYPDNDEQAREIVARLDKRFKEALRKGELTPNDFCPLTGDYQVGDTGGIFVRLCYYNEDGYNGRRVPSIREEVLEGHLDEKSSMLNDNLDMLVDDGILSNEELDEYKELIKKKEMLGKELDPLLLKGSHRFAPRVVPLGGRAEKLFWERSEINERLLKIEKKIENEAVVSYIRKELGNSTIGVQDYEHPFKGFKVRLYGHSLGKRVSEWPTVGEDEDGALAALASSVVRPEW